MEKNDQKVFICLSRGLLSEIDRARIEKQVSRSAFIRESLVLNLHYYNKYERNPDCFPREDIEVNFATSNDKLRDGDASRFNK